MSDAPAGWYPDPSTAPGGPGLRYWDGVRWTHHVHDPTWNPPAAGPSRHARTPPVTRPTTPDGQPLAGWWHRVGASFIDSIFAIIAGLVATAPAQISLQRDQQRLNDELQRRLDADDPHALSWFLHQFVDLYRDHAWIYVIPGAIVILGHTAFLHLWGGTPGQLVTGLRTRLRAAPGPLSWPRALVRVLAYSGLGTIAELVAIASGSALAIGAVFLLIGIWSFVNPLWAAWDGKRQALHDKLVASNVVSTRP